MFCCLSVLGEVLLGKALGGVLGRLDWKGLLESCLKKTSSMDLLGGPALENDWGNLGVCEIPSLSIHKAHGTWAWGLIALITQRATVSTLAGKASYGRNVWVKPCGSHVCQGLAPGCLRQSQAHRTGRHTPFPEYHRAVDQSGQLPAELDGHLRSVT